MTVHLSIYVKSYTNSLFVQLDFDETCYLFIITVFIGQFWNRRFIYSLLDDYEEIYSNLPEKKNNIRKGGKY